LPMVCERRGVQATVIGNTHFTPKTEGPHPTPSLLLSPPTLIPLRRHCLRPPSTGRPFSTSCTSHTRHQDRAYSRSVRSATRIFRRAARLPARSSADHHRCARLEEKQVTSHRSMRVRRFRSILSDPAVHTLSTVRIDPVQVLRSSSSIEAVSLYSRVLLVVIDHTCLCGHTLLHRCSLHWSLAIASLKPGWRLKRSIFECVILPGSLHHRSKSPLF